MQLNCEIGKIYDSIYFFREYYYTEDVEREYISKYENSEFMTHCFKLIRDKIELPELLCPLFYTGNIQTNVISEFFANNIDFENDTIDSFIKKLSSNIDIIYQKTLDKIFESYQKENSNRILPSVAPATYFEAIKSLNVSDNFKLQVSLLVSNFNYAISLFTALLKDVYALIDTLHNKYQKEIDLEYNRIQSESNLQLYEKVLKYNKASLENTTISISLLCQYFVLGPLVAKNGEFILFGIKHEEELGNTDDLEKISLSDFLVACGNELRIKILYSISENGEMTLSQLSKLLETSPPTMLRHIEVLEVKRIIQISRREGLQIFYKINTKLFKYITHEINSFISEMQLSERNN